MPGDLTALDALARLERPVHPDAAEVAALLWDARRLTGGQLEEVWERARSIRRQHDGDP